jgi:hypothetical protein
MPSERDLIRVVVEIIVELRETDEVEDVDNILGNVSANLDAFLLGTRPNAMPHSPSSLMKTTLIGLSQPKPLVTLAEARRSLETAM